MPDTHHDQPHIVMILCDQLRWDAVGFMGNPQVRTPNLDALAEQGVVLEQMHVTSPGCMPSRASLLTGRHPRQLRFRSGTALDHHETTLATVLQRNGYQTAMLGKLHLTGQLHTRNVIKSHRPQIDPSPFLEAAGIDPHIDDPTQRNYGFQHSVTHEDILWEQYIQWVRQRDAPLADRMAAGDVSPRSHVTTSRFPNTSLACVGTLDVPMELYPTEFVADAAVEYFQGHHQAGPCFMHVSFVEPHPPLQPPPQLINTYDADALVLPPYRDLADMPWPPVIARNRASFNDVTESMARVGLAHYYAMIEMVDRAVGRLLDTIRQLGQWENTIFIFASDHGEFAGEYGLWHKPTVHCDGLVRSPCFIAQPGRIAGGRRSDALASLIDIMPTILTQVGLDVPDDVTGQDMSPLLRGNTYDGRPYVFTQSYAAINPREAYVNCHSVRTADARLVCYSDHKINHLFDLTRDPHQRCNLYDAPEAKSQRDELTNHLIEALAGLVHPLPRRLAQF